MNKTLRFILIIYLFSSAISSIQSQTISKSPTKENIYSLCNINNSKFLLHTFTFFMQHEKKKCIAIFADKDNISYGRFRAPLTKVFILRNDKSEWVFEYKNQDFGKIENVGENEGIGSFGKLYDCELKKIGNDDVGLIFNARNFSRIMPYYENNFTNGCEIVTWLNSDEDQIEHDEPYKYVASFKFIAESSKKYYDIQVLANGNVDQYGNNSDVKNKIMNYIFSDGKYLSAESNILIGDVFYVGKLKYQVNKVEFTKKIENLLTSKLADGIYLIVYLTVINNSRESVSLMSSKFKVLDSENNEFETSQDAISILFLNEKDKAFILKDIPPKIPKELIIPFEVPSSNDVYKLKVSGSFWSDETSFITLRR